MLSGLRPTPLALPPENTVMDGCSRGLHRGSASSWTQPARGARVPRLGSCRHPQRGAVSDQRKRGRPRATCRDHSRSPKARRDWADTAADNTRGELVRPARTLFTGAAHPCRGACTTSPPNVFDVLKIYAAGSMTTRPHVFKKRRVPDPCRWQGRVAWTRRERRAPPSAAGRLITSS